MSKRIRKLLKELTQRDFDALKSIYDFRCLSLNQIYERHYKYSEKTGGVVSDGYLRKKIKKFERLGLIELEEDGKVDGVYFLTTDGVKLVKEAFDLPNNIYDSEKRLHQRGYLRYSELKVAPRFIAHQFNLNQFVLDFTEMYKNVPYKYEDEKHIKEFVGIRPDGILTIYDIDFFLEMDMGTEDRNQLIEKWDNYREFINSKEFFNKERKIVVLFIVEGISNIEQRKDLIKRTLYDRIIDVIDKDIDFYVDTKENLLEIISKKIIPSKTNEFEDYLKIKNLLSKKFNFTVANGRRVKNSFNNEIYDLYIRKEIQGKLVSEFNKVQEFIVEEFLYEPMSTINKISYFEYRNSFFKQHFKRGISMIVVADNEFELYESLKLFDLLSIENVYFTTLKRLQTLRFNEALFRFTTDGNIFHFTDNGLNKRVYEGKIKKTTD